MVEDGRYLSTLYTRKCDLEYKKILGRKFGKGQFYTTKLGSGFLLFVLICFVIFFPLLFYSTANPTFIFNSTVKIKLDIQIEGFRSLYQNQLSQTSTDTCRETALGTLFNGCKSTIDNIVSKYYPPSSDEQTKKRVREDFGDYDSDNFMQAFAMSSYSEVYWSISAPSRLQLSDLLHNNETAMNLQFITEIHRLGPANSRTITLTQGYKLTDDVRLTLSNMVKEPSKYAKPSYDLILENAYNPFLVNKAQDGLSQMSNLKSNYGANCTLGVRQDEYLRLVRIGPLTALIPCLLAKTWIRIELVVLVRSSSYKAA